MTDKKERSNVIPLMPNKRERDIVKAQFDNPPAQRVREHLDKINKTMAELKQMAADQRAHFPAEAVVTNAEQVQPSTLPSDEELAREYRRKQDEAKKKREQNNRNFTREYRLTSKRTDPSYDK